MWAIRAAVAVLLLCSTLAFAQEDTWTKVRYSGGLLQTSVDAKDWDNHLEVTLDRITLRLKDGQGIVISTKDVTALSYGQEAGRRIGKGGLLLPPVGLVKLVHKSRDHFIGLEFATRSQKGSLLLQGDKDNYEAILKALTKGTGLPVATSEEDRRFVPREAKTVVVPESSERVSASTK